MIGPCTAHWPPPEGTKMFTTPAPRKDQKGSVSAEEMATKPLARAEASPVPTIMPMIPP